MIDARRMEVYCALYDHDLNIVQALQPMVIDADSFRHELDQQPICFCGDGAAKCRALITHPAAQWADNIVPTAAAAGRLAFAYAGRTDLVRRIEGKDIAYFEPNYLKQFIAAPSHVKGLH